ncbi:PAS domain S-box protein [Psychroflexus sp. YR1-1]|uniref:histidine kinase n=1 Tax=Psychroflexus aurantiacus TaxID=2709310 RepID=A0A6B3R685_9FLAO|nr:PAS domain-containing sensor histidine kinase [Psychroflexus aurantiacus]NEV94635.1 PAS domain S-box protein [Psychroflexus aurantiacus]
MAKEKNKFQNASSLNPGKDFQKIDVEGDIFKQIFKYSTIPTLVHDITMNIINANDSLIEELGYSKDELLNKSVFDLHPEDEIKHSHVVLDKMKHEERMFVETCFKRKDGSVFIAEATPCKYLVGDKPIIHVFIQNITSRKKAEQKLKNYRKALEEEVNKVKLQSKEIKLRNQELKEFAFIVAHDLKAPATNLSTLTSMIDTDAFTDQQNRELFDNLKKSINQLHKTVFTLNDVINFKATLNNRSESLKFENIFNGIKKSIAEQIKTSNATLRTDFSKCPIIVYPHLHLKSVMHNLLVNAIKYRDPNKALIIEVKTTKLNGRVCLKVKDNGLGFDASKYRKKMFGLFKRLHTHVEGKGIGMYIVKTIIDTHGGEIVVKSKPYEGALFKVYLNEK